MDSNTTTEYLPRFLQFLTNVAEAVQKKAEEEGMGRVTYEIVQLREQSENSNGLSCVRLTYTEEDGEEKAFKLFAGGQYRHKSIVKIERENDTLGNEQDTPGNEQEDDTVRMQEKEYVLCSSNSNLILAWISF